MGDPFYEYMTSGSSRKTVADLREVLPDFTYAPVKPFVRRTFDLVTCDFWRLPRVGGKLPDVVMRGAFYEGLILLSTIVPDNCKGD